MALATWTEPQSFELATGLRASAQKVMALCPWATCLRSYVSTDPRNSRRCSTRPDCARSKSQCTLDLRAPTAGWLVDRLGFARDGGTAGKFRRGPEDVLAHYRESLESALCGSGSSYSKAWPRSASAWSNGTSRNCYPRRAFACNVWHPCSVVCSGVANWRQRRSPSRP